MIRSRVLVSAVVAVLTVLAFGLAIGHRLGAASTAQPVVRQSFVVTLDPDAPDFIIGPDYPEGDWFAAGFDDSSWAAATSYGVNHVSSGIPGSEAIWSTDQEEHERVLFRRHFAAVGGESAGLEIDCDNAYTVFVNGVLVGADDQWGSPEIYDLSAYIREGDNVLAIEGVDEGGTASLAFRLSMNSGRVFSDSNCRALPIVGAFENTAWKAIPVAGLSRSSRATIRWQRLEPLDTTGAPRLRGLRHIMDAVPILVRDGEVLVQLTSGGRNPQPIVEAGGYRLVVDTAE